MRLKLMTMLVALAALGALVAGCGSSDDDSTQAPGTGSSSQASSPAGEVSSVTIASVKENGSLLPWLAAKEGFFADQGLDVTVTTDLATSSIVPSLAGGRIQGVVGTWSTIPLFLAGGLDVVGIANTTTGSEDDAYGIYVKADSPYEDMADLEGKTIAVNTLGSQSEVGARKAAVDAGLDKDAIELVPIPFSEMPAALRAGKVDAAQLQEPYVTLTEEDTPLRSLNSTYAAIDPDKPVPNTGLLVMREFYDENPETVKALQAAIAEAVDFANENPDVVREALTEYAEIDPAVAQNEDMGLPTWSSDPVTPAEVQYLADLLAEYGLIEEEVDVTANVKTAGG